MVLEKVSILTCLLFKILIEIPRRTHIILLMISLPPLLASLSNSGGAASSEINPKLLVRIQD